MKKPREKKHRRRRRARVKKRKGPVQLWLPLQMPLALGAVEFVAKETAAVVEDVDTRAQTTVDGEQRALF